MIPTVGTALIILFGTPNTAIGTLLSAPIFVGVGLISYSAYLWHLPLFVFARLRSLDEPSTGMYLTLSVAALALAYGSWRYIERPFRDRQKTSKRQIFYGAIFASFAMIIVGLIGHFGGGFKDRIPDDVHELLALKKNTETAGINDKCRAKRVGVDTKPADRCIVGNQNSPSIAILGDSHADSLTYVLGRELEERGLSAEVLIYGGCVPITGLKRVVGGEENNCRSHITRAYKYLADNRSILYVILSARWTLHLERYRYDNGEGGKEHGKPTLVVPDNWNGDEMLRRKLVSARYGKGVKELLALGKTVVLVYPIPEVGWDVPDYLARAKMLHVELDGPLSTSYMRFKQRNAATYQALDAIGEDAHLIRVLPSEILCNDLPPGYRTPS